MQARLPAALELAAAQAWQPLQRLLRLAKGFGFITLVVDAPVVVSPLKQRLRDWLGTQQRPWIEVGELEASEFAERSLRSLFAQMRTMSDHGGGPGVAWLEAHRGSDATWAAARRELFSRLNERRSRLELELAGPLILLLPAGGEREFSLHAPDLWHVRLLSLHLQTVELPAPAVLPDTESPEPGDGVQSDRAATGPTPEERRWLAQWRGLFGDRRLEQLSPRDQRLRQPSLSDGLSAVRAALASGRLEAARGLAQELRTLVDLRTEQGLPTEGERRGVLDALGEAAEMQGDWAQAEAAFQESLALSRLQVERLGGTPESLRDLSISLDDVARVAQAHGDWAQAEALYRESLGLSRLLVERLGRTPESLRDLCGALGNFGRVAQAQGDWAQAQSACSESLAIGRQLVERLGRTPRALRDLSVTLNDVGRVAQAQGDLARAKAAYLESLALRRQLVERLGATPDTREDLASSLALLAALPPGDSAARGEAQAILESLSREFPSVPRYLERLEALRLLISPSSDP